MFSGFNYISPRIWKRKIPHLCVNICVCSVMIFPHPPRQAQAGRCPARKEFSWSLVLVWIFSQEYPSAPAPGRQTKNILPEASSLRPISKFLSMVKIFLPTCPLTLQGRDQYRSCFTYYIKRQQISHLEPHDEQHENKLFSFEFERPKDIYYFRKIFVPL